MCDRDADVAEAAEAIIDRGWGLAVLRIGNSLGLKFK